MIKARVLPLVGIAAVSALAIAGCSTTAGDDVANSLHRAMQQAHPVFRQGGQGIRALHGVKQESGGLGPDRNPDHSICIQYV